MPRIKTLVPLDMRMKQRTAMETSPVSWQSAFWSLPPIAINAMMQPSGRVFSYDLSLRTYLRSSPIVCILDATLITIRFATYLCITHSPFTAASRVIAIRNEDIGNAESWGFQHLEQSVFLRGFLFIAGVLPQIIKLLACSGLPWTQTWACFYLAPFVVVEAIHVLAQYESEAPDISKGNSLEKLDWWLARGEQILGAMAILLQLAVLALVDLAGIPPDPIIFQRWKFRTFRLIGHFISVFIYLPFILFHFEDSIRSRSRRNRWIVLSILVINVTLLTLHALNYRFSQMYFMWSILISVFSWLLFSFDGLKKHVLLCSLGNNGWQNVLVFDFFCRILCFSLFWYIWYYDSTGTAKPNWADYFG
ncbi:hypothetical protein CC78DRAFT_613981 [Lojkania enalia]|uniref:Uncharacterized protein n=1 Tax=Lojkania enalia TaxID=147567 RepID=A0A9P4KF41_9PLEO|nr:hypothetical protein CC78DRAFT_613981 [Didymosphaeria enalia]